MSGNRRLKVVFAWHMHQPQYQNLATGEYQLPWTYLHAIKDYVDMAAHLEAVPQARAVVNFAPILLEQLADYAQQIENFLKHGSVIRDPLLAALVMPVLPTDPELRKLLVKNCLRANRERLINRFPAYKQLADISSTLLSSDSFALYLSDQFFADIVVWYHLAWMGETVRRSDKRVQRLIKKSTLFTLHDRRELTEVIGELLSGIIGRYRKLAERGQVELSVTPYAHPIVPLLLQFASAKEAMPNVVMPLLERYPDGEQRARWHIEKGVETFKRYFGCEPKGCWPSEGGVSDAALGLLEQYGFKWAATGEQVLRNTLTVSGLVKNLPKEQGLHRPYRIANSNISCFFRDDGLSDLIGFTYQTWHADDAVANLIHHLENIATTCAGQPESVVSIIMDGENAWESYPENGYYFLRTLYERLSQHPKLELTTFSACVANKPASFVLPTLVAGSWVYGTFSTWIGNVDKNRGWDMLGEAKRCADAVLNSGRLTLEKRAAIEKQLAICEGSDWFWWFGDYNPADTVSDFEHLFRLHLSNLYQLLGEEPPDYLSRVFAHGGGTPALGGVMRRGSA